MRRYAALLILACLPGFAVAFPWNKDMVDQPSVKAQETRVEEPTGSVPVKGKESMPVPRDLSDLVVSRMQAAATMRNPVAVADKSVARGKELYEIHCAVCHGHTGTGDGKVGQKFVPPPMDLSTDYVQQQPDGQIFYTITHGGVAMPFYRDAVDATDRWHIINYIKRELGTK